MTVKLTFEFDTNADAIQFLQDMDGEASEAPVAAGAKRGRGRPPKAAEAAAPSPAAPVAEPVKAAAPAAAQPAATVAAVPFKAVADAITNLADADLAKAKAVLAQFGVAKASDLKPEQFGPVVEACAKAIAPSPAAATSLI